MLGCQFIENGNEAGDIWKIYGNDNTFVEGMTFNYGHISSPKCRSDVIAANGGQLLFFSQDSLGYVVAYQNEAYHVIVTTFILGALINGDMPNRKIELMQKYLSFLEGTTSGTENPIQKHIPISFVLGDNYPDPFAGKTTILFKIYSQKEPITLTVYNIRGEEIKTLYRNSEVKGSSTISLIWDGLNKYGLPVPQGTYIYRLRVGEQSVTKKMILVR